MATLAKITGEIRTILKIASIILGTILVIFLAAQTVEIIKRVFFPQPPAPPEQKFGKLPGLSFPKTTTQNLSFRINTISGILPTFPDRIKVYRIKLPQSNLLALESSRRKLASLGFSENETKLSNTLYQWAHKTTGVVIKYDILSKNFELLSPSLPTKNLAVGFPSLSKSNLVSRASDSLTSLDQDLSDIDLEKSKVSYFQVVGGNLIKTEKPYEAQVVRVDFWQKDVDRLPFYYPDFEGSIIYILVGAGENTFELIGGNFNYLVIDRNSHSAYPLKTAQAAFEDLKRGDAYIFNNSIPKTIDITDVSLGYYMGGGGEPYLHPIVVFKGKDFRAYVDAISQ